jgi:iron(II)-dependent oxidoreductase
MDAAALRAELVRTRQLTLELIALATDEELCTAYHPDFSPVGWHLGHIATFEAFWVLERAHGQAPLSQSYDKLFDPRQIDKARRSKLPLRTELLAFALEARRRTLECLPGDVETPSDAELGDLRSGLFVYRFVLMHEQQHAETIATILRMRPAERREAASLFGCTPLDAAATNRQTMRLPGGLTTIGENDPLLGYDNERPAHAIILPPFEIDARPVSNAQWLEFVDAGGYERPEFWSPEGWAWCRRDSIDRPFSWTPDRRSLQAFGGDIPLPLAHPVEGISAYEADAFVRWAGRRLPTEFEWEHAARAYPEAFPRTGVRCGGTRALGDAPDFVGNVWSGPRRSSTATPASRRFRMRVTRRRTSTPLIG